MQTRSRSNRSNDKMMVCRDARLCGNKKCEHRKHHDFKNICGYLTYCGVLGKKTKCISVV